MSKDDREAQRQRYNKAFFALAGNLAPKLSGLTLEEVMVALEARARKGRFHGYLRSQEQSKIGRSKSRSGLPSKSKARRR